MERPVYHIPGAVREKQEARDFVGPLDLILHLLRKDKIAIRDIPLAEILRQYLDWMSARERLDLEVAGEFIAMASQLMYLKTRMLLAEEDQEALSEMEALIASLEERERRESFIRLQEVLPQLEAQSGRDSFTKGPEAKFLQRVYRYEHKKEDLTAAVLAWQARKEADRPPDGRLLRRTVRPEPYRVEEKLRQLLEDLEQEGETTLTSLVKRSESRSEVTAVFLALLQLCREGRVHVAGTMEDPAISLRPGEDEKEGGGADGGS
ncbi:MAG: segregation/condensation protein A [Ruminiclostridium sp.]|jgi:segregation and condensation protein A|nr:segregation/condensation protein A [Ruminiclostridium sp.]